MVVKSDECVLSAVDLTREFIVHKIRPGLFGAIRGLLGGREKKQVLAVDHIFLFRREGRDSGFNRAEWRW